MDAGDGSRRISLTARRTHARCGDSRRRRAAVCASHLPQAHLLKGVIGRDQPVVELWSGRDEAHDEIIGATHCRFNGEVLLRRCR